MNNNCDCNSTAGCFKCKPQQGFLVGVKPTRIILWTNTIPAWIDWSDVIYETLKEKR